MQRLKTIPRKQSPLPFLSNPPSLHPSELVLGTLRDASVSKGAVLSCRTRRMGRAGTGGGILSPEGSAGLPGSLEARNPGSRSSLGHSIPWQGNLDPSRCPGRAPASRPVCGDGFLLSYPATVSWALISSQYITPGRQLPQAARFPLIMLIIKILPVGPWDGVADKSQQDCVFQTFMLNKQSKQRRKQLRHNPSHECKLVKAAIKIPLCLLC